ncbi:MAG TPA: hypothetical protein PLI83_03385 [Thermomonas sp.]|nr:hypothetical protein [Thermomonas sp.]HOZ23811.1 hypothetical protein [Thermomonas sp.]HPM57277.1 hypothetical protein [Thermomonas sp.]
MGRSIGQTANVDWPAIDVPRQRACLDRESIERIAVAALACRRIGRVVVALMRD